MSNLVLRPSQIGVLAAYGVALWFGAALMMRVIGPLGAFHGPGTVLLYALVIPATVPFVLLARKVAGLARDQTALGIAIVTGVAALLDGAALAWFRPLYGVDPLGAAAAILWGAGVGLVLGVILNGPERAYSA